MGRPSPPRATYRLQIHGGFRLPAARAVVPYLRDLGISHVYCSPLFAARRGSTHGYDVVDPARLNPEVGSEADLDALVAALRRAGMGLIADIVPNHMAASVENPWWRDVLEKGRGSPFARFFDIDWDPPEPLLRDRVLLPVLGEPLEQVVREGRLRLGWDTDGPFARLHETRLPLDPLTCAPIVAAAVDRAGAEPARRVLARLLRALEDGAGAGRGRTAGRETARGALRRAHAHAPARRAVERTLEAWNDAAGGPGGARRITELLDRQHYVLSHWREAGERINYRRFFDINDLAGLRMEDPAVFSACHRLLERWLREGKLDGVRVDHVDGLRDPLAYLRRLRRLIGSSRVLWVEKILQGGESMPPHWPVDGTTGYDFLNLAGGLFVDARGVVKLDRAMRRFTKDRTGFPEIVVRAKRTIIALHFGAELRALARLLHSLAGKRTPAPSEPHLREALAEVTVHLPVYRTYVRSGRAGPEDLRRIRTALREAGKSSRIDRPSLRLLRKVLTSNGDARPRGSRRRTEFVDRWQQWTGAVMAKGFEDTALYRFPRLLSLNEVGGEPDGTGVDPEAFGRALRSRALAGPRTMLAGGTHDTKRGEDVRARISVLSELPDEWMRLVGRWHRANRRHGRTIGGAGIPAPAEELFVYQTLLGAWPLRAGEMSRFRKRIAAYIIKAAREAKVSTSWIDPVPGHEEALSGFVEAILADRAGFVRSFGRFAGKVATCGAVNGLSGLLIRLTAPGVPDTYQGSELWDLRLVDPDNRGPVDHGLGRRLLRDVEARYRRDPAAALDRFLASWKDGRLKLFLLWRTLQIRRLSPDLFDRGETVAVRIAGRGAARAFAFARRRGRDWLLAVVPRLVARFVPPTQPRIARSAWKGRGILLPPGAPVRWEDLLTGRAHESARSARRRVLPLADLLGAFPVALLAGRR